VQAQADAVYEGVGDMPGRTERYGPAVFSGITDGIGQVQARLLRVYWLLLSGVGLLLLLACANAANLMLARNLRRLPALALRSAIGASRWRLLRELLVESALLSAAAGALGIVVAWFLIESFEGSSILAYLPALEAVPMDRRVLAFVFLVGCGTVIVAGWLPSLAASRADAASTLKSTPRVSGGTGRLSSALVAAQVALAVVLLSGAGVLFRTVSEFQRVDLGVRPQGVISFVVAPPRLGYDAAKTGRLLSEIRERLEGTPGVERVGVSFFAPFTAHTGVPVGLPGEEMAAARRIVAHHVSTGYFDTLGIPLLAGRPFERTGPGIDPPREVVLSASLAKQLFGSTPPVGQTIVTWSRGRATPKTVVAVARDTYGRDLREGIQPVMYEPFGREMRAAFQVRSALPPAESALLIRGVLAGVDPELPASDLRPVSDQLARNIAEERLMARLAVTIALLAALLGTSGVYAIMSFAVAQRRREFGIRMALGAPQSSIGAGVLRRAAVTTGAGLAAGLGLYAWSSRFLESRVFEVTARDPLTLTAACALLMTAALAAAWMPARRATAIDPTIALRSE
jgi:predicted permease